MLIITDINGETEGLTGFKTVKRYRSVNGEKTLAFTLFYTPQNAHSFDMVVEESIIEFDGESYRIKHLIEKSKGNSYYKEVVAVHTFFDLIDERVYGTYNGLMTFSDAVQYALGGTVYTWSIVDPFSSRTLENFGDDNRLSLLQKILALYGAEYTLNDTHITFKQRIGSATDLQFRYNYNIKTIARDVKTNNLSTYIKGYGKKNEDGTYAVQSEYTSPNSAIFGIRHARPVRDESYSTVESLNERLIAELVDEPEISITVDFADLRRAGYPYDVPNEGDDIFLIYEPMGIDVEVRVVDITEDFTESSELPIKTYVTLANIQSSVVSSFVNTQKQVNGIFDGSAKLPYNVLDDAVKRATEALQSAQTELEFNNGIIAREKTNPNKLVLFNSGGMGISTDGGSTFTTAMTADGIVADVITGGQINANNVIIYGGDLSNYTTIQGAFLESRGNFSRTWRNETTNHDIKLKFENGYLRARNDTENRSLYFTDYGISTQVDGVNASGTLEFFSKINSALGRGVTLTSEGVTTIEANGGAIYLTASTTINANAAVWAPSMVTTTTNAYIGADGELRVVNKGTADTTQSGDIIYRDVRAQNIWANSIATNEGTNLYLGADSEIRATARSGYNNGSPIYRDFRAANLWGGGFITSSTHLYLGSDSEVRLVNKGYLDGSGGALTYRSIRGFSAIVDAVDINSGTHLYLRPASTGEVRATATGTTTTYVDFRCKTIYRDSEVATSDATRKKNITDYTLEALPQISATPIREFHLLEDLDTEKKRLGIIMQEAPSDVVDLQGYGVETYAMISMAWKAIQELAAENEALKQRITNLETAG